MTNIIIILISILGSLSAYILNVKYKLGPVKASALPSLFVAVAFFLASHIVPASLVILIPRVFFGASFIGMSAEKILGRNVWAVFSGIIFGIIFMNTTKLFVGFGGGLGTTAFLSVLMTLVVKRTILYFRQ